MQVAIKRWALSFVLIAALVATCWFSLARDVATPELVVPPVSQLMKGKWEHRFVSDAKTPLVHAASLVELPNGDLRGFWFAGSREGAADVCINSARLISQTGEWTDEHIVIGREWLETQWGRPIRKLGNMVPVLEPDGSIRMFLVAVSFGGWAAGRVVVLRSTDEGANWAFEGELKTSPFLNISNLVKTPPVRYQDGTIGLPVYHEFLGKFGELLRIDQQNRLLSKSRIGHGRKAIQPVLLVTSPQHVEAFFRPVRETHNNKVYISKSNTAGRSWQPLKKSELDNPGSALGGVALSSDHWLLAGNCNGVERDDLCVRETTNGGHSWSTRWLLLDETEHRNDPLTPNAFMTEIESNFVPDPTIDYGSLQANLKRNKCKKDKGCLYQFDYPFMLHTPNGDLHILFTWNKSLIGHAWYRAATSNQEVAHDD